MVTFESETQTNDSNPDEEQQESKSLTDKFFDALKHLSDVIEPFQSIISTVVQALTVIVLARQVR